MDEFRNDGMVESLVKAVKDHQQFRQLACYSIECISKTLNSNNANWRDLTERAINCGAVRIIFDVLKRYWGDDNVLGRCLDCLLRLLKDHRGILFFSDEKKLDILFSSIERGNDILSDNTVVDSLILFGRMLRYPKLFNQVHIDHFLMRVVALIEHHRLKRKVCVTGLNILNTFSKRLSFRESLCNNRTIHLLLSIFESFHDNDGIDQQSCVLISTTILLNLIQYSNNVIKIIKENEGENIYISWILCSNLNSSSLLQENIQHILCALLDENTDVLIGKVCNLDARNHNKCEFEKSIQLLSAIATTRMNVFAPKFTEELVRSLTDSFGTISMRVDVSISRLIASFASIGNYTGILEATNSVAKLSQCLLSTKFSSDTVVYVLCTITSMVRSATKECISDLQQLGSYIIEVINFHKAVEEIVRHALIFLHTLENIRDEKLLMSSLYEDYPTVIVSAMSEYKSNNEIQVNGTKILIKLFSLRRFQDAVSGECASLIIRQTTANLNINEVIYPALDLLNNLPYRIVVLNQDMSYHIFEKICDSMFSHRYDEHRQNALNRLIKRLCNDEFLENLRMRLSQYESGSYVSNSIKISSYFKVIAVIATKYQIIRWIEETNILQIMSTILLNSVDLNTNEIIAIIRSFHSIMYMSRYAHSLLHPNILQYIDHVLKNLDEESMEMFRHILLFLQSLQESDSDILDSYNCIWDTVIAAFYHSSQNEESFSICIDLFIGRVRRGFQKDMIRKGFLKQIYYILKYMQHNITRESYLEKVILLLWEITSGGCSVSIVSIRKSGISKVLMNMMVNHRNLQGSHHMSLTEDIIKATLSEDDISGMFTFINTVNTSPVAADVHGKKIIQSARVLMIPGVLNAEDQDSALSSLLSLLKEKKKDDDFKYISTALMETLCERKFIHNDLKDYFESFTPWLLKELDTSPSLALCNLIQSMTKLEHLQNYFCIDNLGVILTNIIAMVDIDYQLVGSAVISLQHLVRNSAKITEIVTDPSCLGNLFFLISSLLREGKEFELKETLELLLLVGKENPAILINENLMEVIKDILYDNLLKVIFRHAMRLIILVASSQDGLLILDQIDISKKLHYAFTANDDIFLCPMRLNLIASVVIKLMKCDSILSNMLQLGFENLFITIMKSRIQHSVASSEITSKIVRLLSRRSNKLNPNQIGNLINSVDEESQRFNRKSESVNLNETVTILRKCYIELLFVGVKTIYKADALKLLRSLQYILLGLRSMKNIEGHKNTQFFSILNLNQVLSVTKVNINCEVFVMDCFELANEVFPHYRDSALCCIGKIARQKQGIINIARDEILLLLNATLTSSIRYLSSDIEIPLSSKQAKSTLSTILNELANQIEILSEGRNGQEAIFTILYNMSSDFIDSFLALVCEKCGNYSIILLRLLQIFIAKLHFDFPVRNILDSFIESDLDSSVSDLSAKDIKSLTELCNHHPITIQVLERLSILTHGPSLLVSSPGFFVFLLNLLDQSVEVAVSCSSILSHCVSSGQSSILEKLKDAHVAPRLLESLNEEVKQTHQDFVKNVVHVVAHLMSVYELYGIEVGCKFMSLLQKVRALHDKHEYIQSISQQILDYLDHDASTIESFMEKIKAVMIQEDDRYRDSKPEIEEIEKELELALRYLKESGYISFTCDQIYPLIRILVKYPGKKKLLGLVKEIFLQISEYGFIEQGSKMNIHCCDISCIFEFYESDGDLILLLFKIIPKVSIVSSLKNDNDEITELLIKVFKVMSIHIHSEKTIEEGLIAISQILVFNKKHLDVNIQDIMSNICHLVSVFKNNQRMLLLLLRILGTLSTNDRNINLILDFNLVQILVSILQSYLDDPFVVSLTVKIFSNLGTIKDQNVLLDIIFKFSKQGGFDFLVSCFDNFYNDCEQIGNLLIACYNLTDNSFFDEGLDSYYKSILENVLNIVDLFCDDPELTERGLEYISLFTVCPTRAICFLEFDGIGRLIRVLQFNTSRCNCSESIALSLANVLRLEQGRKIALHHLDLIPSLVECMEKNNQNIQICKLVLATTALLSPVFDSRTITQDELFIILKNANIHLHDIKVCSFVVEFLAQLSKFKENIIDMMQNRLFFFLYRTLDIFSEEVPIVLRALKTLHNILSSLSDESSHALTFSSVKDLMNQVIRIHAHKVIQRLAKEIISFVSVRGETRKEKDQNTIMGKIYCSFKRGKSLSFTRYENGEQNCLM